jgi:hypothetical protein
LDATHFRQRAARAREMAQSGDDIRLSRMLLEVALDLEAEAEAIEAAGVAERRGFPRLRPPRIEGALLRTVGPDADTRAVSIVNLSVGGAKARVDRPPPPGTRIILELPSHDLQLDGTILRVRGANVALAFDTTSSADPGLARLLRTEALEDPIQA